MEKNVKRLSGFPAKPVGSARLKNLPSGAINLKVPESVEKQSEQKISSRFPLVPKPGTTRHYSLRLRRREKEKEKEKSPKEK